MKSGAIGSVVLYIVVFFVSLQPKTIKFNNMNKYLYLLCIVGSSLLASCITTKELTYFQNLSTHSSDTLAVHNQNNFEPTIGRGDRLEITILTLESEAAEAFNATKSYLVDTEGYITYPILGKLYVDGLKKSELVEQVQHKLELLIKDPMVIINFGFRVTILGAVRAPGVYTAQNERLTLLEALGLAGDITSRGKRDDVLIIRDNNGVIQTLHVDLKSIDAFSSAGYYLQQNDVVYIAPIRGVKVY